MSRDDNASKSNARGLNVPYPCLNRRWATLTGRLRLQRLWQKPSEDTGEEESQSGKLLKRPLKALRDLSNYGLAVKARTAVDPSTFLRGNIEVESLSDLKNWTGGRSESRNKRLPVRGRATLKKQVSDPF
jgi:hypothetical protein